jgi:hypothetical protein
MGLIETLVEHVTLRSVLVLVPGLLLSYILNVLVIKPLREDMKLAKMPGARPPKTRSVAPFGEYASLY